MPARLDPQAAVVDRRILEREPERGHADRRGLEKGGVLVSALNFPTSLQGVLRECWKSVVF
jgi:hypothetical protein